MNRILKPLSRPFYRFTFPCLYKSYSLQSSSINLQNIDKVWPKLKEDDQDKILDHLYFKQQENWNFMTLDEKKTCYYISFGQWGPRDRNKKEEESKSTKIIGSLSVSIVLIVLGVSLTNYVEDQEKLDELIKYEQVNPEN